MIKIVSEIKNRNKNWQKICSCFVESLKAYFEFIAFISQLKNAQMLSHCFSMTLFQTISSHWVVSRDPVLYFFFLSVTVSKHSSQEPGPTTVSGHQQMSGSHYKFKGNLTKGPLQRCRCGLSKSIVPGLTTQRGHYCPWAWRRRILERQLLEGDLINTLMLGKIEGKRRTRQQKMRWLDRISDSTDMNLSKLREIVEDRRAWYATIHRAIKSWRDLATEQQQSNENLDFDKGKGNIF